MKFWKGLGKVLAVAGKTALVAAADTVASGKPITLGNLGRDAVKVAANEVKGGEQNDRTKRE